MARRYQADSITRSACDTGAIRGRRALLMIAPLLLAVLVSLLALLPAQPTFAQELRWVLTQTVVNPGKENLEYYGGGRTPGFFGEERFKDMVVIYNPSATSFSVKDRWQDREYMAWDVTITCNFSAPEKTLLPGKPYKLTAKFSHAGTMNEPHPGETFSYSGSDIGLAPNEPFSYYPSNSVSATKTWTFTAPTASHGATMEIYAGLWNTPGCTVIWKYEARAAAPEYGVIEKDGVIHLISPPGGVLRISRADLPEWARDAVATVGDVVACVGPPATLTEGDPTVLLDGKPVARAGDGTSHGGTVVSGNSRILVNGVAAATVGDYATCPMVTGSVPHVGGPIVGRPGTATPTTTPSTTNSSATTQSSTTTSTSVAGQGTTMPRLWTDEEFERRKAETEAANGTMKDGYVGVAIAAMGDCELYDYRGERVGRISVGQKIRIGDTIRTASDGRVRVQMADRNDALNAGPSVINVASDSAMAFSRFLGGFHEPSRSILDLLWGSARAFVKGWGQNSSVSVKTGVTILGIRGSDVLITYDPDNEVLVPPGQEGPVEVLLAWVLEGHLDVTNSQTGKTVALTDKQRTTAIDGAIRAAPLDQEDWDEEVQRLGLEDMQPLSAEEWESLVTAGATPTTAPPAGQGTTGGQQPRTFAQAEFEGMLADVVAFAEDEVGRGLLYEEDLLKEGYVGLLGPASGGLSLYDYAGREVDLSVPGTDADDRGHLLPIRIGDTVKTGAGRSIVYLFACYRTERLMLEIHSNTEVIFASAGDGTDNLSATVPSIVRGMVRASRHSDGSASGGVLSLEADGTLFPAGTVTSRSDIVILHYPEKVVALWVHEGSVSVTSPGTDESKYVSDDSGWVIENGDDGSYRPLTDDLWDDITVSSTMDDVKPCKVVAVTESGRPDGRPLALVEFEKSNLALILAVVIPAVVVATAAAVGIYLLRRRRRADGSAR